MQKVDIFKRKPPNCKFLGGRSQCDPDLNLEIRDGYINVYYKGNSLLKLTEAGSLLCYKAEIHPKFLEGINIPLKFTEETIHQFMAAIPLLKENIIRHGDRSRELEYEQMIIRANNFEPGNNTEYFIVDRQYAEKDGRFDLNLASSGAGTTARRTWRHSPALWRSSLRSTLIFAIFTISLRDTMNS